MGFGVFSAVLSLVVLTPLVGVGGGGGGGRGGELSQSCRVLGGGVSRRLPLVSLCYGHTQSSL